MQQSCNVRTSRGRVRQDRTLPVRLAIFAMAAACVVLFTVMSGRGLGITENIINDKIGMSSLDQNLEVYLRRLSEEEDASEYPKCKDLEENNNQKICVGDGGIPNSLLLTVTIFSYFVHNPF